jgi:hypothetical protein
MDTMMALVVDEAIIHDENLFNRTRRNSQAKLPSIIIEEVESGLDERKDSSVTTVELIPIEFDQSRKYVKWGVKWNQQPAFMIMYALFGTTLAGAHHLYYSKLDHTFSGSDSRQLLGGELSHCLPWTVYIH